jgi:COMPASS component BRE2
MSAEGSSPKREGTPSIHPMISSVPLKRGLEDDHQPTVSSPLNPDFKPVRPHEENASTRERAPRAKKESLKKRESKVGSSTAEAYSRHTPDPKTVTTSKLKVVDNSLAPIRYKLPAPKVSDFDTPKGPILIFSHTKVAPDGSEIHFHETPSLYLQCLQQEELPLYSVYSRSYLSTLSILSTDRNGTLWSST